MHPALRLRKLTHEQKSIISALIGNEGMSAKDLMQSTKFKDSQASFSRLTAELERYGLITKSGRQAPWTLSAESRRFALPPQHRAPVPFDDARVIGHGQPFLSPEQVEVLRSSLPASITDASTFIKALSERFIIDLSWASSNLEGNTYDYLDTEKLILNGEAAQDKDAVETQMILNHKRAVEWLLDIALDGREITSNDVCVLHSHLMQGLLPVNELGAVRNQKVSIGGSSYRPSGDHMMLRAGMVNALNRANATTGAHEASLGLLAGFSYLQAFNDGNKRTARLLASIPLLRAGFAPLSFVGWEKQEYTVGLVVYYETGDPSILADGFVKNQIDNAPVYHELIRAQRVPSRIEITRRKETTASLISVLSEGVSVEDAVASNFVQDERVGAVQHVSEILDNITKVNAPAFGVNPDLIPEEDNLSF